MFTDFLVALTIALVTGSLLSVRTAHDRRVEVAHGVVQYAHGVSRQQAIQLADAYRETGVFNGQFITVRLARNEARQKELYYAVTREHADNAELMTQIVHISEQVAPTVFPGETVLVRTIVDGTVSDGVLARISPETAP
ncbi:MAG: hypothetical protein KDA60_10285 [Planctomycetales bacterium]|nr:hypothetical protein [Planctomycetales bacterium]